jgi:hypothetical protein
MPPQVPFSRRDFLINSGGCLVSLVGSTAQPAPPRRIAAAATVWTHNSHADLIIGRLVQTHTLDGHGPRPNLQLVSLFVDQFPEKDRSRALAREYGFHLAPTITDALTLGGHELAVDGVLLIAEHGKYPENAKGQTLYPRRRFFEETVAVFERNQRVVPVFTDKHLAASWDDAKWMYDTAQRLRVPLLAGSSLPVLWRKPPLDVTKEAKLTEMVAVSYHTLDGYGFHALEMVQCLVERRAGGETGLAAVQCLEGPAAWEAGKQGRFDRTLLDAALARTGSKHRLQGRIEDVVKTPIAFFLEYADGFKASVLTLNYAVGEWAVAWREQGKPEVASTLFWTQEARPFGHFTFLVQGIEQMMHSGKPTWPVERTLLTTGALDALLTSKLQGGKRIETPHLRIKYLPTYAWREPPPPPPGRPLDGP